MTRRFGMVVDLNRCVGCQTCTIACKHANDTVPGVQWRRVIDVETGTYPDVERLFLVTGCQHCAEPPCVPVCPTGATFRREDGIVAVDYDLCIGCGYCAVACPYQARTIAHDRRWYFGRETEQERAVLHPEREGVVQKCTFCSDRVDAGLAAGLVPGVDPPATPACASACISQAIQFGDLADDDSHVSRLSAERGWFGMHAELGTEPGIRYLYETPAVPGREPSPGDVDDERLSDPANPLVGARQQFWDLRAALNFTLGGMGSGLALVAWVASLAGVVAPAELFRFQVTGGLLMAIGLLAVFLEIGRKLRFANVVRRPGSSWMTREVYAVAVFYPALTASLIWPGPGASAVVAVAAGAFLVCQARILHAARGIPAWRVPLMPWMLVATGLAEGVGLIALALPTHPDYVPGGAAIAVLGVALALANARLWQRYVESAKAEGLPPLSRAVLARLAPWVRGVAHAAPALLYAAALATVSTATGWLMPLAGGAAVAGGALWKIAVVTRACHHQGFALGRYPQKGSGALAAPRRMAPRPS